MALLTDTLQRFEALQSDDIVKTDLELTCTECGEVVCDIEAGDNLKVLCSVADDHVCETEHDYEEYESREELRDHLVAEHRTTSVAADNLYDAGGHHVRTMHRILHREDPDGD